MKATIGFSILLAMIAVSRTVNAQVSETNSEINRPVITNIPPTGKDPLIPLIQFIDVPITTAIENLARQAGINYLIDPKLIRITGSAEHDVPEPTVSCRLVNVTARDTLNRMLNLRQVVMIEDPATHITRFTSRDQATNVVDASLLGMDTNNPASAANEMVIPLIQFQEVPLSIAVQNLIQQTGVAIEIDPRLDHPGDPRYGSTILSVRWENVTARQALVALCLNYDLIIVKDAATGVIQIKPKPGPGNKSSP